MNIQYGQLLKKSWEDLKKNYIIFLPLVYGFLAFLGLGVLVVLEVIFFKVLGLNLDLKLKVMPQLSTLVFLSLALLLDLCILILISISISSMGIELFTAIAKNKKATSQDMWNGLKKYTFLSFKIGLLKCTAVIIPLLVLTIIALLGFRVSKTVGIIGAIVVGLVALLIFVVLSLVITFGLFFIQPIMGVSENLEAIKLIKESMKYTKEHLSHVLITWVIIFGIGLGVEGIFRIMTLPFYLIDSISPILILIAIPLIFIGIFVLIVVNYWLKLFLFNSYFNSTTTTIIEEVKPKRKQVKKEK